MQKQALTVFFTYTRPFKVARFLALLFPALAVTVNAIAAPYILSLFMNRLQQGGITFENSGHLIAIYATLLFVGEVILWRLALYFCWTFEIKAIRNLYLSIFSKLAHEDMSFHANRFGGSLVSQTSKMTGAIERFWDMLIWSVVPMATTVIGSIVALLWQGLWQYAIFIALYAIAFGTIVWLGSRFLQERNTLEAQKSTKLSGYLADMVTNVSTVKAFGREKHEAMNAARHADEWHAASTSLKWGVIRTTTGFSTLLALGSIGAFVFAVYAAERGIATVGTIYLVLVYTLNVGRQLWEMNSVIRMYNRVMGDAHDMAEILAKPFDLVDHSAKKLVATNGKITFDNVTFAHDNGAGNHIFNGLDLEIPAGQRVGIVGHSGSGKTTLTRLLLRFSDVSQGAIRIDDQDVSRVTQESLHRSIAYVSQEPILFHRTLAENIAYGKPKASRKDIIRAAKQAHAWEFIQQLPDELNTMVGERGVKLSGGQRQRIAIARAILKDAPILVLDEATSALDSTSEKLIQASLEELMDGRTSIVIAHRLSTIAKLDRIIVLENGEIVEDGTHHELLAGNGIYATLWSRQSGGFLEE